MKNFFLTIALSFVVSVAGNENNELWKIQFGQEPLTNWKYNNISAEITDRMLRLRETGPKSWGTMYRYIERKPEYRYLQIYAGRSEADRHILRVSNTSKGGRAIGTLIGGMNTFDLQDQPESTRFALTVLQEGINGIEAGPWADLSYARLIKVPERGVTVELLGEGNIARVGDNLRFRYFAGRQLEQPLILNCYIIPQFLEFQTGSPIVLTPSKDNPLIYEAVITIDKNCTGFISQKGEKLTAVVNIEGEHSSGTGIFGLNIDGVKAVKQMVSPEAAPYRRLWEARTRGTNLSLGKEVGFSQKPSYRPNQTTQDSKKLTNGLLSTNSRDRIWFDKESAGWANSGAENGVKMLIDLGKVEPLDKLVIRCLGGKESRNLIFPRKFELHVSKNGQDFFLAASMQKLMPGEKAQSDFNRYFYLEENGQSYVYPFELNIQGDARYIGLTVYGETSNIFTDEIAVMKAESPTDSFNQIYAGIPKPFYTRGIVVKPLVDKLIITTNMTTYNYFSYQDMREPENIGKKITMVIEVPEAVKLLQPQPVKNEIFEENDQKRRRLEITVDRIKSHPFYLANYPLFFTIDGALPSNAAAVIYAVDEDGVQSIKSKVPVEALEIPEVPPLRKLYVGPGWMQDGFAREWPDFMNSWRKLGFNHISVFPTYWKTPQQIEKASKFADDARKHGFGITMVECPFHIMMNGIKPGHEMFSLLEGRQSRALCPSYRGQAYQDELKRVSRDVAISKPDYIFWDIECWYPGATEAASCLRCREGRAASGLEMDEYLKQLGTGSMMDLKNAVRAAVGNGPMPVIGSYNHHKVDPVHHIILDFNRYYPDAVDIASPSLYVVGRAADVHRNIRKNYQLLGNKELIPWLTAGTYGEFEPYKMEAMILESFLNGCRGITYYYWINFDTPLDYYYHAKALSYLAPHEELVFNGKPFAVEANRKDMYISALKHDTEILLLIGNYDHVSETVDILLPATPQKITDLRNNEKFTLKQKIAVKVPKGDIRLLYIKL